jgi:YVTN family beta-propeller protein
LVPAAAANLPNGKVLLWSAEERFSFSAPGRTFTSIFDPATSAATEVLVSNTGHNMFCPGTSNLPDGRLLVNGGIDSGKTSLYDATTNTWTTAATMNITRGYNANCVLQDGSVFTLGGSWSGGVGGKHGEVWSQAQGWRRLTGVPVTSMLSVPANTANSSYDVDSHFWLIPAGNGKVLYAGPGFNMQWIDTRGSGSVVPAGPRGDDEFSVNGNAVMYEAGKILKTGGAPAYEDVDANANSYVIDVTAGLTVRKIAPTIYPRTYHNSVVLPNGQVMLIGGMTFARNFSDDTAVLAAELFDPVSETFTLLPAMNVPRTYHGVALLLPDARVLSAGGGLCGVGCAANHPDLQIYTPHYLLNADGTDATRPVISSAPTQAVHGTRIAVATDSPISSFALIRLSSVTHATNNDQRRVAVPFTPTGVNAYELALPSNPGILLPGHYMLFAMNVDGVPSVAHTLRITSTGAPTLENPGDRTSALAQAENVAVASTGATSFAATGLPPGLAIDTVSGAITGTTSQVGRYAVTLIASNATAQTSTQFTWQVGTPTASARYFRLEALSEVSGASLTTMAEFNLLDANGALIPRGGWSASASSSDGASGAAANVIDGSAASLWRSAPGAALPQALTVDTGASRQVSGFRYTPRNDGSTAGTIAGWRWLSSNDGSTWTVLATGNFANLGGPTTEKTVLLSSPTATNQPPVLPNPGDQTSNVGQAVSLALGASDPDGDTLTHSATNLPPGLTLDPVLGFISGTPSAPGSYLVALQVSDGRGGIANLSLNWTVAAAAFAIDAVAAPVIAEGAAASYAVASNGGVGTTYTWNFGDGTPTTAASTSATQTHTFAAPGIYNVSVAATQPGGATTTRSFVQAVGSTIAGTARPTHSSTVAVEALAGGGSRVWLVNQDNDSVSVFDGTSGAKVAEIAVGEAPRSVAIAPGGRVWVSNKGSATISVIDRSTLTVVQTLTLPRASMPFGLAFAPDGTAAFLALEATGQLLKLHPTSGTVLGMASVGAHPRHLSVTAGGERALVSRFVTPPLPGESTATVVTEVAGVAKGGEVVVVGTAAMAVEQTIVLRHSDRTDTSLQGAGVPNYLAVPLIAPDGRSAWVPSKQDNVKRGALRSGQPLDFQNTVRAITSRIDLVAGAEDIAARIDHDNSSLGSAAAFHPSGAYLFVALQTSRQVAVVDAAGKRELFRIDVGRAPDGLAVSADGRRLYVDNFMDRTLGVHDLSRLTDFGELSITSVAASPAVASEKLTAQVLQGKRLFYDARDPRLARDSYMSCASCHSDGGQDGRVWDMTGFGEGLRNTIALRGRGNGHGRAHWTGNFDEVQDFEAQIRSLGGGLGLMSNADFNAGTRSQPLGDPKAGLSSDLDALAAYVASLNVFAASPQRPSAATVSAAALEGRLLFSQKGCASCHAGAPFTNSAGNGLFNVGTLKPASGQRLGATLLGLDVPTLRDVWATAPYLHDGSAVTLDAAITAHTGLGIGAADALRIAAYLREVGSEEGPAPVAGALGTIWPAGAAPAQADDGDSASTNVGTKFRSDLDGYITAIRFYKAPLNTGTHVGALWTAAGQQLATVTFTNETASGWQQADLATPVPITANTVYVVSYRAPNGHYTGEDNYFATGGLDNPPLHALRDGDSGANGLYGYGSTLAFPTQTYKSESYWVDVVFTTSVTDTTAPAVTATAPANGATGVALGAVASATFSEALDAASVNTATFQLTNTSTGTAVAGTVAYDSATRVASFTPSATLAPGTSYTALLRGGGVDPRVKDAAGNPLTTNVSWSFTTVTPDLTPPTISSRTPTDGASGVSLNATVTVTFSESLDPATVNANTLQLRTAAGAAVSGAVTYNAATRVATLTPATLLSPSTTYTATAVGGAADPRLKDLAGNALIAPSSWSFTTVVADTTAPSVTAIAPAANAVDVPAGAAVVVTFNEPMDAASVNANSIQLRQTVSGTAVAATVTYAAATQSATLTPTSALAPATAYTLSVRGGSDAPQVRDAAGNVLASTFSSSFTTATAAGPACPCTIWPSSAVPAVSATSDAGSVNLGVKFRSDIAGYITGVRFYKGSGNGGTHVGSLWSSSGQLLAQATFTNESASGWQQVNFGAPVAIVANTTYVASYLAPVGRYAIDTQQFASVGVDAPPLRALSTAAGGGNGVYAYAAGSTFPTSTYNASNYWVDVVFATTATDTTAPSVSARTPAAGATGVAAASAVTVTFSEPIDPTTVSTGTVALRDAQGAAVPASVSYNAATAVATLVPSAALLPSSTYTATLRGGAVDPVIKDVAGNRLAADNIWSFTTAAVDTTPPTVTATSPANAATGVSRTANITVTFSEAMNSATIDTSTFELRTPAGAVVPAGVTYSATNRRATLNPNPTLTALTTYTVIVRGGAQEPRVKDAAGNALAVDRTWSFTTR